MPTAISNTLHPFFSLILMCQVPFFIFHHLCSQYPSAPKAFRMQSMNSYLNNIRKLVVIKHLHIVRNCLFCKLWYNGLIMCRRNRLRWTHYIFSVFLVISCFRSEMKIVISNKTHPKRISWLTTSLEIILDIMD